MADPRIDDAISEIDDQVDGDDDGRHEKDPTERKTHTR